jgi:hypothetical protein
MGLLLTAVLALSASAQLRLDIDDVITVSGHCLDSSGIHIAPDSVQVIVYKSGTEQFNDWFGPGDPQCAASNGMLVFSESVANIDNDAGVGVYEVRAGFFDDQLSLYNWKTFWLYAGSSAGTLTKGDVYDTVASLLNDSVVTVEEFWAADSAVIDTTDIGDWFAANGGGIDSASLAGIIWNTPAANHNLPGTFGGYLDAEVSGLTGGSGAHSVDIIAIDSGSLQPVPQAGIAIRNSAQTALLAVGHTDSDGRVGFNLDDGTYAVVATGPGLIFSAWDTLVVNGPTVDTIAGYQFDPGDAPMPGLCRVYGFLYSFDGLPVAGATVSALLPDGAARTAAVIISPMRVHVETDSSGYFYLDLIPSSSLLPTGTEYEFGISRPDGSLLRRRVLVPDSPNWQLIW